MSRQSVRWSVPLTTSLTGNSRVHHHERARTVKAQRTAVRMSVGFDRGRDLLQLPRPLVVTLVRVAPRRLDDDNLRAALKGPRDAVAELLGLDDRDPRLAFRYAERKGEFAVEIEVCGPCRLVEIIVDVPEGHQGEAGEPLVTFTNPDAARWAKTAPDEPCRCPADEPHEPGCALYRPGPKVAP